MTVLETLRLKRVLFPTPMSSAQLGELLNAVAWAHRDEGYGLLSKPQGGNCRQPQTGEFVSRDILALPDGRIFDVLIDAENKATPTWGTKKPVSADRWRRPVDATVALPPPDRPPPPTPARRPYNDQYAREFGWACNDIYRATDRPIDPGMIAVQASRAAWDYYVGGLSWDASRDKHVEELRAIYQR